jgi:hypothetical protein
MLKILGSAEPKYLAATDLLIGDMSNINYEFLLYDRPIVLLANEWVKKNFPDIGIKTDINHLGSDIDSSLKNPDDYKNSRKLWLERTISIKKESASKRYISLIMEKTGINNPEFIFIIGNNAVRKTNLAPLIEEVKNQNFKYTLAKEKKDLRYNNSHNAIIIGAHFVDLWEDVPGYKVHIDHDLKGIATANLEYAIWDYKRHAYFPHIDLHIIAGEAGEKRTKLVLGPHANRTVIGGYPKGDDLNKFNTSDSKDQVYDELGFEKGIPLVTYAPAGKADFMKPGGSLNNEVIQKLKELAEEEKYHVLIKLKYHQDIKSLTKTLLRNLNIFKTKIYDDGSKWRSLFPEKN